MFKLTPEASDIDEVIKKIWPESNADTPVSEESSWEILDTNNSEDVLKRHWFKQNYSNQISQHNSVVMYH